MKNTLLLFALSATCGIAAIDLSKPVPEIRLHNGKVIRQVTFISYAQSAVAARWTGGRGTIAYTDFPDEILDAMGDKRPTPPEDRAANEQEAASINSQSMEDWFKRVVNDAPKLQEPPLPQTSAKTRLIEIVTTGQVFVTTKGGSNVKLGGIDVAAYPADEFLQFEQWRTQATKPIHDYYMSAVEKAQRSKSYDIALAFLEILGAIESRSWTLLPEPMAKATTDADGRYRLAHKIDGDWVVVALGRRELGDDTERYIWTVPVSAKQGSGELLLHNANMR